MARCRREPDIGHNNRQLLPSQVDHSFISMLNALVAAQDALARLEASAEAASAQVREGLLNRLTYREAAGHLAHHGKWVHPLDLAMRDLGLTGSYAAAGLGSRLPSVLPATSALSGEVPDDRDVAAALRNAHVWRRLAQLRTWSPDSVERLPVVGEGPALVAAVEIMAAGRLGYGDTIRAAWLWRERGGVGWPGLPIWSAPVQQLHRAGLSAAPVEGLLGCIAEAAVAGRRELARLNEAEGRGRAMRATARSHLPRALDIAVSLPIVTARLMGEGVGVSPRAGAELIGRMVGEGLLREATGRKAWRGFVLI